MIIFLLTLGIIAVLGLGYALYLKIQAYRMQRYINQILSEWQHTHQEEARLQQELITLQDKTRHAFEDPITHLIGWQLFEDRLQQTIKESERYQLTMGVLFVDIDDFKVINDGLSYEVGDLLLAEVGKRLQGCIRQVDSISRFAKDTFVILLSQLSKPGTAAVVAQRMLQALDEPFQIKGQELCITACIGISIYPTDGDSVQLLLRSADHALHLAKEKGRHLYQFYQENLHTHSQRELYFYTGLNKEAIFQELVLYYQPIVNTKDQSIMCMDALLHWQHPVLGLIQPHELLHYAEKQRKANALSEWLLQHACRQFKHWRSLGFNPQLLGVPILITQLENSHFIYRISQILQEQEFKPEWLLFEIKGGACDLPQEALEKSLNMLKYLGVKIAIDDFGSSPFSFIHLKNFGVNYLKLDASVIKEINQDDAKTIALITAMMNLAQQLSLEVIIQGIESGEQISALKALSCVLMQGQFLAAPLSESEVQTKMVMQSSI